MPQTKFGVSRLSDPSGEYVNYTLIVIFFILSFCNCNPLTFFMQNSLYDTDSLIDVLLEVKIETFSTLTHRPRKPPNLALFGAGLTKFLRDFVT